MKRDCKWAGCVINCPTSIEMYIRGNKSWNEREEQIWFIHRNVHASHPDPQQSRALVGAPFCALVCVGVLSSRTLFNTDGHGRRRSKGDGVEGPFSRWPSCLAASSFCCTILLQLNSSLTQLRRPSERTMRQRETDTSRLRGGAVRG